MSPEQLCNAHRDPLFPPLCSDTPRRCRAPAVLRRSAGEKPESSTTSSACELVARSAAFTSPSPRASVCAAARAPRCDGSVAGGPGASGNTRPACSHIAPSRLAPPLRWSRAAARASAALMPAAAIADSACCCNDEQGARPAAGQACAEVPPSSASGVGPTWPSRTKLACASYAEAQDAGVCVSTRMPDSDPGSTSALLHSALPLERLRCTRAPLP